MDSPEYERKRVARVKELEQMVKKLEQENQKLLSRVHTSASVSAGKQPQLEARGPVSGAAVGGKGNELVRLDSLEDGLMDLNALEEEEKPEDEWLYASPVCPPTPSQKQVTPVKWLSEGHAGLQARELPSLDDVRKALSFTIDEAENLSKVPEPRLTPPLTAKNKTARKYLDQVRARRQSPPAVFQDENEAVPHQAGGLGADEEVPVVRWKARVPMSPTGGSEGEAVPRVRWNAQSTGSQAERHEGGLKLPADDVEEEPEFIPKVAWRKPVQVPSEDDVPKVAWRKPVQVPSEDDVPKVAWRKPVQVPSEDDVPKVAWRKPVQVPSEDDVPKVTWRKPVQVPSEDDVPKVTWRKPVQVPSEDDVPKVRWKRQQVAEEPEDKQETGEALFDEQIPKVRWKVRQVPSPPPAEDDVPKISWKSPKRVARLQNPQQHEENIPKVNWKAPVVPEPNEIGDDVPIVHWKPQTVHSTSPKGTHSSLRQARARNMPVKAILTYRGRRPDEDELSQESLGSGSDIERGELGGGVVNGGDSDLSMEDQPIQRVSRYQAHHISQPSDRVHSPQYGGGRGSQHPRRVSPSSRQALGSRSPSPLLHHSPQSQSTVRSRSPSPLITHRGQQASSGIPQAGQKQTFQMKSSRHSPRSVSPASRPNVSAQAQTGRLTSSVGSGGSPVSARRRNASGFSPNQELTSSTGTTPAATSRHPSGLPPHPSSTGSRTRQARTSLQSPKTSGSRESSPRVTPGRSGLTPPSGSKQAQQQYQGKPKRRVLPVPQSNVRSPSGGGARSQAQNRRAVKPPEPAEDDSWLEGCF